MANQPKSKPLAGLNIVFAKPAGVTKKVAEALGRQIKGAYLEQGKKARPKGIRFIPSTRVDLGEGKFQVLANTVIEVAATDGRPSRSEAIDVVATIDRQQTGQVLTSVKIPALEMRGIYG